jgi:hypothetical protein
MLSLLLWRFWDLHRRFTIRGCLFGTVVLGYERDPFLSLVKFFQQLLLVGTAIQLHACVTCGELLRIRAVCLS